MNYLGQTHTVTAELPPGPVTAESIAAAFRTRYASAYGRLLEGVPVRVLNLRTEVIGQRPKIDLRSLAPAPTARLETREHRRIWCGGWVEASVHDRLALPVGAEIRGPAVLEQADATILIEPGQVGRVDGFGNLILEAA
jgi:N-methylhydantoinase A